MAEIDRVSDATPTVGEKLLARDRASEALAITLVEAWAGHAVTTMTVTQAMLNGFDVVHGGLIFAVADTAFAVACNETEAMTLAAGAEISFLRPVRTGQVLTATADRRSIVGRSGIYDVQVTDETGAVVAEFRGRSRTSYTQG